MKRIGVATVLVGTVVGVLFAMSYAKAQAAILPALWEPRALPPDWPIDAYTILCAGWVLFAVVWAVVILKQPAALPPVADLPPPGTYAANFVPPNEPDDETPGKHWVKPAPKQNARQRYESRRRRIPVVTRERRKRVP